MNGRMAKKLRKMTQSSRIAAEHSFMLSVANASFRERLRFAWAVLFSKRGTA